MQVRLYDYNGATTIYYFLWSFNFIYSFREILLYIILFYLYVRILCIHLYRITVIACLYLSEMTNKDVE